LFLIFLWTPAIHC